MPNPFSVKRKHVFCSNSKTIRDRNVIFGMIVDLYNVYDLMKSIFRSQGHFKVKRSKNEISTFSFISRSLYDTEFCNLALV